MPKGIEPRSPTLQAIALALTPRAICSTWRTRRSGFQLNRDQDLAIVSGLDDLDGRWDDEAVKFPGLLAHQDQFARPRLGRLAFARLLKMNGRKTVRKKGPARQVMINKLKAFKDMVTLTRER